MKCTLVLIILSITLLGADPIIVSGGSANDYEGWIARINDGRLMVVFCRNPDWASGDLYVTFSSDNGATWDSILPVILENGDQATLCFVQMPYDTLRLWYASNENGQYGIFSAYSMDGVSWTREGWLDIGWSTSDMFYDPTVILEPDSSLTMSYRGPGGAYIVHKPYHGTWDTLLTLVGSGGYRPRIMKHSNGTYLYTYHRNIGGGQYEVFVRTSLDRITWTAEYQLTSDGNSHDPFANETSDGAYLVYYATYIPPAYNLHRRRSYDAVNWEMDEQITSDATNNTQPHYFIEDSTLYLLWAHAVSYPYDHDVYFEPFVYLGTNEGIASGPGTMALQVVPSICTHECTITFDARVMQDNIELEFYDIQGRMIKEVYTNPACEYRMSVHDLATGVYLVRCPGESITHCTKLVVVH